VAALRAADSRGRLSLHSLRPLHLERLRAAVGLSFFFLLRGQGIDSFAVTETQLSSARQNIGLKGLICKILPNKGLAAIGQSRRIATLAGLADWFGLGRTMRLCAFHILGQGCSSQPASFFCATLWKTKRGATRPRGLRSRAGSTNRVSYPWRLHPALGNTRLFSELPLGQFAGLVNECYRDV